MFVIHRDEQKKPEKTDHQTFNQEVMGSNPIALTNYFNELSKNFQIEPMGQIREGNPEGNTRARKILVHRLPRFRAVMGH